MVPCPLPRGQRIQLGWYNPSVLRELLLASVAAASTARAGDWHEVSADEGSRLEVRDVPGSPFEELRVTASFALPPPRACAAIWAAPAKTPEPGFRKREVLRDTGTDRWTYEWVAVPLVSDRDYTVHLWGETPDERGCVARFDLENEKGPAPKKGVVRMPALRGSWVVTAAGDGGTQVVYTLFNDPGGNVPSFVSRGTQRSKTLEFVKQVMARPAER